MTDEFGQGSRRDLEAKGKEKSARKSPIDFGGFATEKPFIFSKEYLIF
ncbi:MAG: hypothetical protein ABIT83_13855 [Massilia sp.]